MCQGPGRRVVYSPCADLLCCKVAKGALLRQGLSIPCIIDRYANYRVGVALLHPRHLLETHYMVEIIPNWHPIFVHFTVALLSVAAVLKMGTLVIKNQGLREQWRTVARWNLWIGAGFIVLTVITGLIAYNTVAHDTPSHLAMTEHRNWALATSVLFLVIAVWSIMQMRAGKTAHNVLVLALVIATGMLATTAWHGGELVYRYGLGVMSLPKVESHNHAKGEDHGHDDAAAGHSHDDVDDHHGEAKTGTVGSLPHDHADNHHDNSDGHHDEKTTAIMNEDHHHDDGHKH